MTKNNFTYRETSEKIISDLRTLPDVVRSSCGKYTSSPLYWIILSNALVGTKVEFYNVK